MKIENTWHRMDDHGPRPPVVPISEVELTTRLAPYGFTLLRLHRVDSLPWISLERVPSFGAAPSAVLAPREVIAAARELERALHVRLRFILLESHSVEFVVASPALLGTSTSRVTDYGETLDIVAKAWGYEAIEAP